MGNFTIFQMFENPRRGRQARNFTTNVPKILDLKSSSEQIFFRKLSWVPLTRQDVIKSKNQTYPFSHYFALGSPSFDRGVECLFFLC